MLASLPSSCKHFGTRTFSIHRQLDLPSQLLWACGQFFFREVVLNSWSLSARQSVGLSLHMDDELMIWSPTKIAHKPSIYAPLISFLLLFLTRFPFFRNGKKHKNASLLFTFCCTWNVRENTYTTQRGREEMKKKEKQIYVDLMALNQSSSILWLAVQTCLDRHQTWWDHSTLTSICLVGLRIG